MLEAPFPSLYICPWVVTRGRDTFCGPMEARITRFACTVTTCINGFHREERELTQASLRDIRWPMGELKATFSIGLEVL